MASETRLKSARDRRLVSLVADIDPRTVLAFERGKAVRESSRRRIERVLAQLDSWRALIDAA